MKFKTIRWEDDAVVLLDQTLLPMQVVERRCKTVEEMHTAIRELAVRGAPLLGVSAAYALCLGMHRYDAASEDIFITEMKRVSAYIKTSRPTAVNLFWALDRVVSCVEKSRGKGVAHLKETLKNEAEHIQTEDEQLCRAIGEHGAELINNGDVILTHCNAGALATAGIGTALAPLYVAQEQGKKFKVYADETRPLLQGARLTAWELSVNGIDTTLICDNMAASLMKKGIITKIIVGADRIAHNGDTANKIGTYGVAVMAHYHKVPFYIAAPYSTFDKNCPTGAEIPIEERLPEEVTHIGTKQVAPQVKVFNPAFDVTPHALITGFITDRGVVKPPFSL